MDRWHSASALEDPPAVSVAEGKPHEPDSSRSPDPEDSSHRALAAITSFIAAFAMAYMLCRLPLTRTLSWPAVIFRSTLYIALTVAAGVATVRFARLSSDKRSIKPLRMCSNLAVGWAFLPPILLLYRQDSPWILLPVALLTLSAVWGLRQIFPAAIEPEPLPQRPAGDLPSLYGLPPADSHLVRTFCIALCAQASLLLAAGDYLFIAGLLLSLSLALTLRSATDPAAARWWIGTRPPSRSVALAITLAVLALLPWVANRPSFPGRIGGPPNPPPAARQPTESESPSSDYVGIVLWPPPVKKTSIAPPAPHSQSFASGVASKPVVIPFDGPYWYFKFPNKHPGARAHVAHGKPTDVNVRSTDWDPLIMEAHQNLGLPIDLACCSEIDVAITNADGRPGSISLALQLTDSWTPGKPPEQLGPQIIASSKIDLIPLNRPPVKEVLRFPIPRSPTLRRFNQITVVFLPSGLRSRAGAKIAIDSFELVPKR